MANTPDRSREKLTPVYSTQDEMEARMVQELLRTAGIESVTNALVDHSLFPLNVGRLAKRDILVLESDAAEARRIIAEQGEAGGEAQE